MQICQYYWHVSILLKDVIFKHRKIQWISFKLIARSMNKPNLSFILIFRKTKLAPVISVCKSMRQTKHVPVEFPEIVWGIRWLAGAF